MPLRSIYSAKKLLLAGVPSPRNFTNCPTELSPCMSPNSNWLPSESVFSCENLFIRTGIYLIQPFLLYTIGRELNTIGKISAISLEFNFNFGNRFYRLYQFERLKISDGKPTEGYLLKQSDSLDNIAFAWGISSIYNSEFQRRNVITLLSDLHGKDAQNLCQLQNWQKSHPWTSICFQMLLAVSLSYVFNNNAKIRQIFYISKIFSKCKDVKLPSCDIACRFLISTVRGGAVFRVGGAMPSNSIGRCLMPLTASRLWVVAEHR